jgi:DNA modification methylase
VVPHSFREVHGQAEGEGGVTVDVRHGDSREVIKGMAEASVHAVVTDPPYSLVSIQKRFGCLDARVSVMNVGSTLTPRSENATIDERINYAL